ncbi:CD63 antigen-like [Ostrea edulis]|uniref:CD63 antigen-like n=1 Tax=Ostrea edulis TaxID=37623 RepID=UPI0024AFAB69|nr:CD63 antigen-like [Ostrea edulis]
MGFFSTTGRIIIVILNIVFVIVSFVMLAAGIVLKFFSDNAFLKSVEDEFKAALKTLSDTTNANINTEEFSLNEVFGTVAIVLIVMGAFLLGVSFFGCCGACYKVQILLILYAVVLIVLLLGQLVMVIVLYASPAFKTLVKEELKVSLKNYKGLTGVNVESLIWNAAMQDLKCCGVESYADFKTYSPDWDRTPSFGGGTVGTDLESPIACCMTIPSTAGSVACALTPTATNNFFTGCFDKIWEKMFDSPVMLAIVLTVTFAVQLLLIIFTILMYRENKKSKVGVRR